MKGQLKSRWCSGVSDAGLSGLKKARVLILSAGSSDSIWLKNTS
jgi:hypothetical protein